MTVTKKQAALAAVRGYLRGEKPPEVEMATAPVLDMWSVHIGAFATDKHPKMFIRGEVRGHPKLSDGNAIETSEIVWLDRSMEWCRTMSRVYRLDGKIIDDEGLLT
jgi:hypothetical protein